LLQEFDLEIRDKKGVENVVVDHLSRLENNEVTKKEKAIMAKFLDEKLFAIGERPWFADMANYKADNIVPDDLASAQKKKFFKDANHYLCDDPYLFKVSTDGLIRRCVAGEEANSIMWHYHSSAYGGHHSGERTAAKILQSGFWWSTLFKDCQDFVRRCDKCQRTGIAQLMGATIVEKEPLRKSCKVASGGPPCSRTAKTLYGGVTNAKGQVTFLRGMRCP